MNFQLFQEDGYQVLKGFLTPDRVEKLRAVATDALQPLLAPVEYEADTGYPGAPLSRAAQGGLTSRRLLAAYARDPLFRALATDSALNELLAGLLGETPLLSQAHHNCVMTKHPGFSSQTLWHQDIRYWAFSRPELVSAWFALTTEHQRNGGLMVIPGSHRLDIAQEQLDDKLFLRPERPENAALIASARAVELAPGDLLLFHCRLFHAAGPNETEALKLSAVFTYHGASNAPVPDTRSALYPSVAL